jgi:hypothetical protein
MFNKNVISSFLFFYCVAFQKENFYFELDIRFTRTSSTFSELLKKIQIMNYYEYIIAKVTNDFYLED